MPHSRRSGIRSGSPTMRCTRNTSSASPRQRNVHRPPSTIGTSCRARKRSTAAASGRRSLSRLIASRRFTAGSGIATSPIRPSAAITRAPAGSAGAVEVEPDAVVEHDAARRRGPAGQLGHPRGVVGPQPAAGVRQQHAAGEPARGRRPGNSACAGALRGPVVEQQHPLGQRHRPGRPGDHGRTGRPVEQPQHVQQHARRARRRPRARHALSSTPPDLRRGARRPAGAPRAASAPRTRRALRAPGPGAARRRAGRGLGVGARGLPHRGAAAAVARHLAQGPERAVELHDGTAPAARPARPGARARPTAYSGSCSSTSCQRAYSRRLTLRPSSSASSSASSGSRSCQPAVTVGDGPVAVQGAGHRSQRSACGRCCGPQRARTCARLSGAIRDRAVHAACTCTVRPTSSSMPRSAS